MNAPMFMLVALLVVIVCFVMGSYVFLFYCKKTIDDYNVFFHDYNHKTKTVIDAYGDFRISNAYVIMTPINKFKLGVLNLITMKNCKQIVDELMHVWLMIEITVDKNNKKLILIDKTNCINVSTDIHIDATCMVYKIKIKNKGEHKITLRYILDETCNRIGKSKFFNWHIYKNNCQHFIKQIVRVINDDFKHRHLQFKSCKKAKQYCNSMFCSKHMLHIYYSILFLYNFFQKYIINVQQHVSSILVASGAWVVS